MTLRTPDSRVQGAHAAFDMLWLLDLAKFFPTFGPMERLILKNIFLAGVLHGYDEANEDLKELEQKLKGDG